MLLMVMSDNTTYLRIGLCDGSVQDSGAGRLVVSIISSEVQDS